MYWYYLEPTVLVNIKKNKALLYNSLNGEKLIYSDEKIVNFLTLLTSKRSQYISRIDDAEYFSLKDFISETRNSFMGDLIETSYSKRKPFQIYPTISINKFIRDKKMTNEEYELEIKKNILNYINQITIHLNSFDKDNINNSKIKKEFVINASKQVIFPKFSISTNSEIDVTTLIGFIKTVNSKYFTRLNIVGRNIFEHKDFAMLLEYLNSTTIQKNYFINYCDIIENKDKLLQIPTTDTSIEVIITHPLLNNKLIEATDILSKSKLDHKYVFLITSVEEYEKASEVISELNIRNVEFKPIFDGNNFEFLQRAVFIEKEDLDNITPSQIDVLKKRIMNPLLFGQFIIDDNLNVFSNANTPKLGNVKRHKIEDLITKEIEKIKGWSKLRRNVNPCKSCIYSELCPPISNYELAMKKNNLCHIMN